MFRKWLKKLILEAMHEGMPDMTIKIEEREGDEAKVSLMHCALGGIKIEFIKKDEKIENGNV